RTCDGSPTSASTSTTSRRSCGCSTAPAATRTPTPPWRRTGVPTRRSSSAPRRSSAARRAGPEEEARTMARVVAAMAMTHAPGLTGWFDQAPEADRELALACTKELRRRLEVARPDVLVMLSNDHLLNWP